jgi:C1A family cysteine protease
LLDERALPSQDFTNYPAFYVIPREKRPRIMQQGQCGSCVAWTTSTALVSVLLNQHKYNLFTGLHMTHASLKTEVSEKKL